LIRPVIELTNANQKSLRRPAETDHYLYAATAATALNVQPMRDWHEGPEKPEEMTFFDEAQRE
jgi:hypothetical protein